MGYVKHGVTGERLPPQCPLKTTARVVGVVCELGIMVILGFVIRKGGLLSIVHLFTWWDMKRSGRPTLSTRATIDSSVSIRAATISCTLVGVLDALPSLSNVFRAARAFFVTLYIF